MKKLIFLMLVILIILPSCSNSMFNKSGAHGNPGQGQSGAVAFNWGGGKYLASNISSLYISITGEGLTSASTKTVAYSSTTVTFDSLPLGSKTAEITALNALGNTLSKGRVSFIIEAGKTTSTSVSLGIVFTDSSFSPSGIIIPLNTTLLFYNAGNGTHSLVGSSVFGGASIASGGSISISFTSNGSYVCYLDSTDSGISATITVSNTPSPPSNLTATAVASSKVNLAWTDSSTDETGFKIERKTGAGGTYAQIAAVGAGVTSYTNTALAASTAYYYRVRAYNSSGDSDYSSEANASTSARYVYVTNNNSHDITVINTATNAVVATIDVWSGFAGSPVGIVVSPDGNFTYSTRNTAIVKINNATNSIIETIALGASSANGLAITSDGNFLYVTMRGSDSVKAVNTATSAVVATIAVGDNPYGVAITPNDRYAYVTNQDSDNISLIDVVNNTLIDTLGTDLDSPLGVTITPNSIAYIASWQNGNISVMNASTNIWITNFWVANNPYDVASNPDGSIVYAAIEGAGNRVDVINTATNTVTAAVTVGTGPRALAVTPDGAYVYAANYGSNNVSVIDTATNNVIATVAAGTNPSGVAITP